MWFKISLLLTRHRNSVLMIDAAMTNATSLQLVIPLTFYLITNAKTSPGDQCSLSVQLNVMLILAVPGNKKARPPRNTGFFPNNKRFRNSWSVTAAIYKIWSIFIRLSIGFMRLKRWRIFTIPYVMEQSLLSLTTIVVHACACLTRMPIFFYRNVEI